MHSCSCAIMFIASGFFLRISVFHKFLICLFFIIICFIIIRKWQVCLYFGQWSSNKPWLRTRRQWPWTASMPTFKCCYYDHPGWCLEGEYALCCFHKKSGSDYLISPWWKIQLLISTASNWIWSNYAGDYKDHSGEHPQ